ncbi:MAG: hypothetical protein QM703_27440 [Gemmatales bacterium]
MTKMPTPKLTENEIVDYLRKTTLPTILVEGEDDAQIYRWIESKLGIFTANVLFCSGRKALLSIYRRKSEYSSAKVAWLADLDMWLFSASESDLGDVIFTTGYSIENDLYAGSSIESLLDVDEDAAHKSLLHVVCRWFSYEVEEYLSGSGFVVDVHINKVIDYARMDISLQYSAARGYKEPNADLVNDVYSQYALRLRGKNLMQAIVRFLSNSKRTAKYSYSGVLELCLKLFPENQYLERICQLIKARLA